MEHREPLRIAPVDRRLDPAIESPREAVGFADAQPRFDRSRSPRRPATAGPVFGRGVWSCFWRSATWPRSARWRPWRGFIDNLTTSFLLTRSASSPALRPGTEAEARPSSRRSAGLGDQTKPIARLDAAPDELAAVFRNYPWVEDVRVQLSARWNLRSTSAIASRSPTSRCRKGIN